MTVRIVADPADCIETALAAVAFTRNHVDVDFEQTPGVKPSPKQLRATVKRLITALVGYLPDGTALVITLEDIYVLQRCHNGVVVARTFWPGGKSYDLKDPLTPRPLGGCRHRTAVTATTT